MSLLALPFGWFLAGSFLLAAALFGLHLLRVRLVRVPVETLLFFRTAQAPLRPRSLVGSPRRILSYLLSLGLLLALWLGFAEPFLATEGRSRVVVVDASGSAAGRTKEGAPLLAARLARAEELARAGLGPRGALLAYAGSVTPLWHAGDSAALVAERAKRLVPSGSGVGLWEALSVARGRLVAGDDVLLLGAPAQAPRELAEGIALHREEPEAAAGTAPEGAAAAGRPAEPLRVALLGDPGAAVRTALAADASLAVVAAAAQADVLVTQGAVSADKPCLAIEPGAGEAEREPLLTQHAPFALSLRDRRGRGTALTAQPGASVWVVDARTQEPLVLASEAPVPCVRIVSWLLDEGAHRDVPRVLLGALHLLAPKAPDAVATVGTPLTVPAATSAVATLSRPGRADAAAARIAPVRGAYSVLCSEPGRHALAAGGRTVAVDAVLGGVAPAAAAPAGNPESCAYSGVLRGAVLALALLLLALESVLYWRGKVP